MPQRLAVIASLLALTLPPPCATAQQAAKASGSVRVTPPELTLPVGEKAQLEAEVLDVGGRPVEETVLFFSRARRSLRVSRTGEVEALQPGTFEVVARVVRPRGESPGPEATVTVTVPPRSARGMFFSGRLISPAT